MGKAICLIKLRLLGFFLIHTKMPRLASLVSKNLQDADAQALRDVLRN